MPSIGVAGCLRLACAHGVGGGITASGCRLLKYLGGRGRATTALLGIFGGGIDLVVGYRVGRRHLELKGSLALKSCPSLLTVTCVLVVGTV